MPGSRHFRRSESGEGQNRTADTAVFSRVLCQLSYLAPAVRTGFEPATSTLTGWRARPGCSTGPMTFRAPNGIRTRVSALKGRDPRPLDDGGVTHPPRVPGAAPPV
jgi:integrase